MQGLGRISYASPPPPPKNFKESHIFDYIKIKILYIAKDKLIYLFIYFKINLFNHKPQIYLFMMR